MCQDRSDVHSLTIIVNGGNQSHLVATDIEDGQLPYLIGAGKNTTQLSKRTECPCLDQPVPVFQRSLGIRMLGGEFVQPLAVEDVYRLFCGLCGISGTEIILTIRCTRPTPYARSPSPPNTTTPSSRPT